MSHSHACSIDYGARPGRGWLQAALVYRDASRSAYIRHFRLPYLHPHPPRFPIPARTSTSSTFAYPDQPPLSVRTSPLIAGGGCLCSVSDWEIAEKTESGVASLQDQPSESLMAVLHKVMPSKQDSGMHAISLYSHAQLCMHVRRARAALTAPSHRAVELLLQPCAAEETTSASERSDPLDL